jgi:hypothetical protein
VASAIALLVVTAVALFWPSRVASHNPVTTTVLFNREIVKIFEQKCVQCHVDGGLAMSLVTFEEARPWAVAIKEEVLARRMPPWPAERGFGNLANDVGLTNRELEFLVSWIDGGVPKGTMEAPPHVDHSGHWMLGSPDAIVSAKEGVTIGSGASIGHTRVVVDPALTDERWIRAIDYKPANRSVVRAAILRVVDTGQYLGTWTPWRTTMDFPQGTAVRVAAGSQIAADLLYQPASTNLVERPQIGLYFAQETGARPLRNIVMRSGSAETRSPTLRRVKAEMVVPDDVSLFELLPEMSPGAKSLELRAKKPDGSFHVLLWIKQFRQGWQTSYVFPQPFMMSKGTVLQAIGHFNVAMDSEEPRFTLTFNAYEAAGASASATLHTASER